MSPAERLRAAADLIERTGAAATPDPPEHEIRWFDADFIARDGYSAADAAWIALVGPDTAPALAAWLRTEAELAKGWAPFAASVAVADLILRGQS